MSTRHRPIPVTLPGRQSQPQKLYLLDRDPAKPAGRHDVAAHHLALVEATARCLWERGSGPVRWDDLTHSERDEWRGHAAAALECAAVLVILPRVLRALNAAQHASAAAVEAAMGAALPYDELALELTGKPALALAKASEK